MTAKEIMQASLEREVAALIASAESHGFVVTIESVPVVPLAMGNHRMVGNVREARGGPVDPNAVVMQPAQLGHLRATVNWRGTPAFGKRDAKV